VRTRWLDKDIVVHGRVISRQHGVRASLSQTPNVPPPGELAPGQPDDDYSVLRGFEMPVLHFPPTSQPAPASLLPTSRPPLH
jgi:hypothetical protein